MAKIKKLFTKGINKKIFAFVLLLGLIAALLPLYRLGLYSTPFYDDYGYGYYPKLFLNENGFKGLVKGILLNVHQSYYSWQGTYASIAFMSFMPAIFGDKYYFISSWVMISMLAASSFCFTYVFAVKLGKAEKLDAVSISVMTVLLLTELIRTAHQGFYWFDGAVHYTFMYGIMLFMLMDLILLYKSQKTAKTVLLAILIMLLAILCAGSNYVTTLQGGLLLLLFVAAGTLKKNKKTLFTIPSVIAYAVGMYLNCSAPGNSFRQAWYAGKSMNAFDAIINSFKQAALDIPEHTGLITVVAILAMAPVLWNIVKRCEYDFKLPGVVTILSFCLYATGYTPSFYGMGSAGVERTWNVVRFTFQLLLVFTEAYWLGFAARKLKEKNKTIESLNYSICGYAVLAALILVCFEISPDQAGSFSSYGAYYYVHTGEAACYKQEYDITLQKIAEADGGDVVVSAHAYRPWLLCEKDELSLDPDAEQNTAMAKFYGVNSIRIDPETYSNYPY